MQVIGFDKDIKPDTISLTDISVISSNIFTLWL